MTWRSVGCRAGPRAAVARRGGRVAAYTGAVVPRHPVALVLVLVVACGGGRTTPAGPIRGVVLDYVDALARGDVAAAYALTDPAFRAACPPERYAASLARDRDGLSRLAAAAAPPITDDVTVGDGEAAANVTIIGPAGARHAHPLSGRWRFVRRDGRWYRRECADRCASPVGAAASQPPAPLAGSH